MPNTLLKPTEYGLPSKFHDYLKGQAEAILSIEDQFASGKRIVFCDAPVGSGKSVIAVLIAKRMERASSISSSLITVQTKALQKQYLRDFQFITSVKGRGNFRCALQGELFADEGLCTMANFKCEEKFLICPYYIQKAAAAAAPMVVTNASFFLTEANYAGGLVCSQRDLLVIDEGHLLEEALMRFVSIALPERSLKLVGIKLPELNSPSAAKVWAGQIWPILSTEATSFEAEIERGNTVDVKPIRRLLRFRRMTDRLRTLSEIEPGKWFLSKTQGGYAVRPFLVDEFVEPLVARHTNKILMMSATFLSGRVMSKLLGLDYSKVGWHQMDSNFPAERRPYNFVPTIRLSWRTKSVGYQRLTKAIDEILERHPDQKGVVHTASFKVMNEILSWTRYPGRFIYHRPASVRDGSGQSRDEALDEFLRITEPRVLLSPSAGLGLDLHDDHCRFQIVAKLPFKNLGDPQIKYRQKHDPEWYSWTTIAGLIQACGRSTRHVQDYSTVYILDSSLYMLLKKYPYLFPRWWKKAFHKVESVAQAQIAVH